MGRMAELEPVGLFMKLCDIKLPAFAPFAARSTDKVDERNRKHNIFPEGCSISLYGMVQYSKPRAARRIAIESI